MPESYKGKDGFIKWKDYFSFHETGKIVFDCIVSSNPSWINQKSKVPPVEQVVRTLLASYVAFSDPHHSSAYNLKEGQGVQLSASLGVPMVNALVFIGKALNLKINPPYPVSAPEVVASESIE
jgi:hypothetical protein